jgi:2-aminoethylphosphonate aminotransferase
MKKIERKILLNPGPATTTDSVKYAQVAPDICPRENEFGKIMESVALDLVKIAGGSKKEYACVLFGGSGTAAMDAVINSVISPAGKILVINNGAYGKRMAEIAKTYKIDYTELKFDWDKLPELQKIEMLLKKDRKINCVAVVHHETTTGLLNPIEEIGVLAKKHKKIFIVDAISSFAGVPFDIKKAKADFVMATSNKCIQGMAGIAFVICKKSELEKIKDFPRRSYYLSLYDQYDYFQKNFQTRFTPPVQTIYALRQAIDEFLKEGYGRRAARYAKNWQILRDGVEKLGFRILTKPEQEAKILITILYPENPNFNFDKLHDKLYKKGYTIYPGKIGKQNAFRLANMGAIGEKDIKNFLKEFSNVLGEMKVI